MTVVWQGTSQVQCSVYTLAYCQAYAKMYERTVTCGTSAGTYSLCNDSGKGGWATGALGGGYPNHHAQWHQPDVPLLGKEQL